MTEPADAPVSAIDSEDREQVERLVTLYDRHVITMNGDPDPRDVTPSQRATAMRAALREFADTEREKYNPSDPPPGKCLAGPACPRETTNGCRPVCGFTTEQATCGACGLRPAAEGGPLCTSCRYRL